MCTHPQAQAHAYTRARRRARFDTHTPTLPGARAREKTPTRQWTRASTRALARARAPLSTRECLHIRGRAPAHACVHTQWRTHTRAYTHRHHHYLQRSAPLSNTGAVGTMTEGSTSAVTTTNSSISQSVLEGLPTGLSLGQNFIMHATLPFPFSDGMLLDPLGLLHTLPSQPQQPQQPVSARAPAPSQSRSAPSRRSQGNNVDSNTPT